MDNTFAGDVNVSCFVFLQEFKASDQGKICTSAVPSYREAQGSNERENSVREIVY